MAQPSDESKSKTLLDPELNPILNPLLAAHMGRWAEVYFTSPPEKREQAVADLLRELAGDSGSPEVMGQPDRGDARVQKATEDVAEAYRLETQEQQEGEEEEREQEAERNHAAPLMEVIGNAFSICAGCGHLNVSGQKFCGMCGRSLKNGAAQPVQDQETQDMKAQDTVQRYWDNEPGATSQRNEPEDFSISRNETSTWETPPAAERFNDSYGNDSYREETEVEDEPPSNSSRTFDRDSYDRDSQFAPKPPEFSFPSYEQDPPARSYRLYIGLAVILLLTVLVYSTWRGNTGSKGSAEAPELPTAAVDSTPAPAAPNSANKQAEGSASQDSTSPGSMSQGSTSHDSTSHASTSHDSTSQSSTPANSNGAPATESSARNHGASKAGAGKTGSEANRKNSPKPEPLRQAAAVSPAALPAPAASQNGSEELATAEKYLRTGPGGAPQAVGWLWKAVAKQNPAATLMLSDLYLRGEGVPKNCDQARLLLDAAARKGQQAAAERLRNLQSYGCQ